MRAAFALIHPALLTVLVAAFVWLGEMHLLFASGAFVLVAAWYYSVGMALHDKASSDAASPLWRFRLNLAASASALPFVWLWASALQRDTALFEAVLPYFDVLVGFNFALLVYSIYATYRVWHFLSERLLQAEGEPTPSKEAIAGLMLQFWFWFIGAWFLRPRLQRALS
ncbi:MAG: hypothetical protein AAGJ10_01540 [Bacteroidota bacterium]